MAKQHPEDRDVKRRNRIYAAFKGGKSAGEIAGQFGVTPAVVSGILARAGYSRGDKPSRPRTFSWEKSADLPDAQ